MPKRISRLPRDARGYPIPHVTLVDPSTGQPDFRVLDVRRQIQCITGQRCGICGQPLGRYVAFIGGPKSGESHTFVDPGMHRDCATYAAKVCPFISRETSQYRDVSDKDVSKLIELGIIVKEIEAVEDDRTDPRMFIYICESYQPARATNSEVIAVAGPFTETIEVEQQRAMWR